MQFDGGPDDLVQPKLRKKAPFTCRHISPSTGQLDHWGYYLKDTDTDLCPQHEAEKREAHDKFWNAPIAQPKQHDSTEERLTRGPIWPLNDDGSPCSPDTNPKKEVA